MWIWSSQSRAVSPSFSLLQNLYWYIMKRTTQGQIPNHEKKFCCSLFRYALSGRLKIDLFYRISKAQSRMRKYLSHWFFKKVTKMLQCKFSDMSTSLCILYKKRAKHPLKQSLRKGAKKEKRFCVMCKANVWRVVGVCNKWWVSNSK